jgi:hypothetical protein
LLEELRSFDRETRRALGEAINLARDAWGHPHLHAGAGIRKLTPTHFECRAGLRLRFVFQDLGKNGLFFVFLGTHDQVRQYVKTLR